MVIPRLLLALLLAAPAPVAAQVLRIGMAAETTSADPHHFAQTPNSTLRDHIYGKLVDIDGASHVRPGLADSWERTDDLTWRFRLRAGQRFSDGAAFGAPDVVATFCRIVNNKDELVGSFSSTVRRLAAVEAEGEGTLVIRTRLPEPLLLPDLAALAILPRRLMPDGVSFDPATACGGGGPYPTLADFNAGTAAIGTGPWRMAAYSRGGQIVLARNPHFPGAPPHWAEVRMLPLPQPAARLASLLAGDQDIVEAPNTADLARLRADPRMHVVAAPTNRLVFLQFDTARDPSPFVQGRNALRDPRVRQALSLALNRAALVDRILDGTATQAAQFLPGDQVGIIPGLKPLAYDPARARALLAEAGYPDGIALTLHATNNRYVNDGPLTQAIVQQWQRVGVKAALETLPSVAYFPRRGKKEFSVAMGGWSTEAGETLAYFRIWLATPDEKQGFGGSNYGGWSDPAFDAAVRAANGTMDETRRAAFLREAGARALDQMPVAPLHFEGAVWAMRAGLRYPGRPDQATRAIDVTEAR